MLADLLAIEPVADSSFFGLSLTLTIQVLEEHNFAAV